MTAKEFGARPSDYLHGLGDYEAFCLDEACAHVLINIREQARKDEEAKLKGGSAKTGVSLDWLRNKQSELQAQGKYKI